MKAAFTVNNLTKSFGSFRAVNNVSLNVQQSTITLLMGPNGSGKTTLINCISGFYKPDRGQVLYVGKDITGKLPHEIVREGLVRTFQIVMPFGKLTVLENLLVSYGRNPGESFIRCLFKGKWFNREREAVEKAFEVLQLFELEDLYNAPAAALSGGQLKLLEIGRALMTDAKMIIMDEPVGSVNPALAHNIFSHIQRLRDKLGLTFFIVEHRLDITAQYVDYVYAMVGGRIISKGKPEEVFNDPEIIEAYLGG